MLATTFPLRGKGDETTTTSGEEAVQQPREGQERCAVRPEREWVEKEAPGS